MRKVFAATALCFSLIAGAQTQQAERFSIATLNIDGLPQKVLVVNVNADGPGSAGTVRIGKYLMKKSFDMVFMQEDFNYHEELTAMLRGAATWALMVTRSTSCTCRTNASSVMV